jgi:hypothetical protein
LNLTSKSCKNVKCLCREKGSSTPPEGTGGEEIFSGGTVQGVGDAAVQDVNSNQLEKSDQLTSHDQDILMPGSLEDLFSGEDYDSFQRSIFATGEYKSELVA